MTSNVAIVSWSSVDGRLAAANLQLRYAVVIGCHTLISPLFDCIQRYCLEEYFVIVDYLSLQMVVVALNLILMIVTLLTESPLFRRLSLFHGTLSIFSGGLPLIYQIHRYFLEDYH